MTQTWWLSFADADRPAGEQFLGVAIVDVTEVDVDEVTSLVTQRRAQFGLPPADPEAVWMAAAVRKSHRTRCNPGGEVGAVRIDDAPHWPERGPQVPRDQLLSKAQLAALGLT